MALSATAADHNAFVNLKNRFGVVYLFESNELATDLHRKKVRVHDYPDGTIAVTYQGADRPPPSGGPCRFPA